MALNYDALTALTRKKWIPEAIDTYFDSHPFLVFMKQSKQYQAWGDGYKIIEPLKYGELAYVQSYAGYDPITYDINMPVTAAEFDMKNLVAPVIIDEDTERKNSTGQVLPIVKEKVELAMDTLQKIFAAQLFTDGTGNSSKDITGLGLAISDAGIYGGINRADPQNWWKAVVNANGAVPRALTLALLLKVWNQVSDPGHKDQPDLHIVDDKVWLVFHELLGTKVQLTSEMSKKLAGYGFQVLEFMGKPVVADGDVPAGYWYMLNTKYMKLRYHPKAHFTTRPWRPDDTRIAKKMEILWTGNLTVSNCRRLAVIKDIDVSAW